jgi:MFS family permease
MLRDRRFLALLFVSFLISFLNAPRYALLPVYVEADLARSPLFAAGLRATFLILGGIIAIFAGRLADRWGAKHVYVVGTVGPLLAGAVFLTGDPASLAALCLGIGVTTGFDSAGGQSYLIAAVGAERIGTASAGYFVGNTLGTALGNLIAGPVADAQGYAYLGRLAIVGTVALIVVAYLILPNIEVHQPEGKDEEPRTAFGARKEVWFLLGLRYLPTAYWGSVTLILPLLIYRLSGSNTAVSTFSAVYLCVAAVCQIATGRLCDKIGRWRPIFVAATLETVSALGLALYCDSVTGIYIFGALAAASAWSLSTTMPGLLQLVARPGERGRLVGLAHFVWSAGMLTGNLGGGRLIDVDPSLSFYISVGLMVGALVCAVGLWRENRGSVDA